jgi:serine phosphatase RsbU (regulator of sigma subunit)
VSVGGHPPPLVVHAGGRVEVLDARGTLLGLVDDPSVSDVAMELGPGDTILLYTDGVTEAGAPRHVWETDELMRVVAGGAGTTAQGLVDHIAEAALSGLEGPPRDDVAMLALRVAM